MYLYITFLHIKYIEKIIIDLNTISKNFANSKIVFD